MEQIEVGLITKPQALKGEFRVKPKILNMKKFKTFKSIYIDNKEFPVEKVVLRDSFVIMKIEGIDTCESAETLRNKSIFAYMNIDKEDDFDYVGFEIIVDDAGLGIIDNINNYGTKDVISVSGKHNFMFPRIDDIVVDIDIENKKIYLNSKLFEEVVVYEN